MKVLSVLTYYLPHVSGLTIYVERVSRALVQRGHNVTVLTSHYGRELARNEKIAGVDVLRVPVLLRASKGVVMPTFPWEVYRLAKECDVVNVHLPQVEAAEVAFVSRFLARKPVVITYHCDIKLPPRPGSRALERLIYLGHSLAARWADRIVTYTWDYAENSSFLSRHLHKMRTFYPPIEVTSGSTGPSLRNDFHLDDAKIVGFAARFAEEKGVDYLMATIPYVMEHVPTVKYVFAGEYKNVLGEVVFQRLQPLIERYRDRLVFLGVLPPKDMARFYSACDVLALPSINSTESFGMVQVEAMFCGTPVVSTDLPGVRESIRVTGMGEVVPCRDADALGKALVKVLKNRPAYVKPREALAEIFNLKRTVDNYEKLFSEEIARRKP